LSRRRNRRRKNSERRLGRARAQWNATDKQLNLRIARRLDEVAQLLEAQAGNIYRVEAYRRAAETLRRLPRSAADIVRREGERQCTVITSQRGPLTGKRIVRGREVECLDYYRDTESASTPATGDREGEPSLGRAASR